MRPYGSVSDLLTPELQAMMESPTTPITDILSLSYISKTARVGFAAFQRYMQSRSSEVLACALSEEKTKASTNAFKILTCDKSYLKPGVENGTYLDLATSILSKKEEIPSFLIGRLGSLTLLALLHLPEIAFEQCSFIYYLLPHCNNPTVFNLFETLTGDTDEKVTPAQEWLKTFGLAIYIDREVQNIDFSYQSTCPNFYKDPVYNSACYLFTLIARGCGNPILRSAFIEQSKTLMENLTKNFENAPDFVKTAQWKAILALTCETTALNAVAFLKPAMALLTEQFVKLAEFRVTALLFITKMMEIAPLTFDLLVESQMPQLLINLVIQFPNSTILHNAFLNFVDVGLRDSRFSSMIIGFYVPVIIAFGETDENRIMKPCCLSVMDLFIQAAKKDRQVAMALNEQADVARFLETVVKPYKHKTTTGYGGDTPLSQIPLFKNLFG